MFVAPGTKTTGKHWRADLGLYLDVEAQYQGEPYWWEVFPIRYELLQLARREAGIDITDHIAPSPFHGGMK